MYPVNFSVDYPDRALNRVTTFFRIFTVIPIAIVLGAVAGGTWQWSYANGSTSVVAGAGGLLFFAPLLMLVFRQKYPRWWFDWNLELQRFGNRVFAYLALMDDRYPATDDHQSVRLDYSYPGAAELNESCLRGAPRLRRGAPSVCRGVRGGVAPSLEEPGGHFGAPI